MNVRHKHASWLLFLVLASTCADASSVEHVLCAVLPLACPTVVPSESMAPYDLTLETGLRRPDLPRPAKIRRVQLRVATAYIDWHSYLTHDPQSEVRLEATADSFLPQAVWKKQQLAKIEAERHSPPSRVDEGALHRSRLSLILSITQDIEPTQCNGEMCGATPSDKGFNDASRRFTGRCQDAPAGFKCWHGVQVAGDSRPPAQLLVPEIIHELPTTYLICDPSNALPFSWCKTSTPLDVNLTANYEFDRARLSDFNSFNERVKAWVKSLIISDQIVPSAAAEQQVPIEVPAPEPSALRQGRG